MSVNRFNGPGLSAVAAEALDAYRFVNFTTGYVDATAGPLKASIADSGEVVHGIVGAATASGKDAPVFIGGVGLLECDGTTAIAVGDYLKPDGSSTGKGIKSAADREKVGAIALEALASGTAVIKVMILPGLERSTA